MSPALPINPPLMIVHTAIFDSRTVQILALRFDAYSDARAAYKTKFETCETFTCTTRPSMFL